MHWLVVLDVLVVGVFGVSGWCFCARGVLLVCYGWWGGSVFFACILCVFIWAMLNGFTVFCGEFDPGSGRTLAACLTHASRTMKRYLYRGLVANG